jgi:hypothetical protein
MKKIVLFIAFFSSLLGWSQENLFTLSGGYAFANIEDFSDDATGWRINGTYEYRPMKGPVAHGFSFGYISTTAETTTLVGQTKYEINTIPVYYAPKYFFGKGSAQGFVKGALGMQFSNLTRSGSVIGLEDNDSGFYGGLGLGGMKTFKENFFINAEYEWAYMSNSFYKDGFMNSFLIGIGMKF